ncbi:APC family permease [Gordonia sp. TBRC 11910]|uniref:APC family permease n=1 Tax=Gordonia asplenii TaxID=2725283 RepID=A0A848L4J3_9ACTN|nr:APC family permease [Gordonia asplenii]NMO03965.1 APC family permease [Gordonia asplenii]
MGPHRAPHKHAPTHRWYQVMCLTGVDYFSTLGYQPGIAALAAGAIAPIATIVLVALTLFGALPVYRYVARKSPNGEGSIAMLEHLLPRWGGKIFVLVLLGFAATDFMITMTLSAADATAHFVENPLIPKSFGSHTILITLILLALLAAVFLRGFTEAIKVAVVLVVVYLVLNFVVVVSGIAHIVAAPHLVVDWRHAMTAEHGSPIMMVAVALLVFPKLALGLSGFETGVAVMPQITGDPDDDPKEPAGRIRGAHRLLTTSALIMSVFLISSSVVCTVLIPDKEFQSGGHANGRALAYLAHDQLGATFGSVYDVSTILILWFAGASAMAGLLNLVPRYLPRYGMAPDWARAVRPLVLVFALVAFVVTLIFRADVDAQGGAYATGVLVLMTSASIAVALSVRKRRKTIATIAFVIVAAIFIYTTIANVFERPEGVQVAAFFIIAILVVSFASRINRSFELRSSSITFDDAAQEIIGGVCRTGTLSIVTHDPHSRSLLEYREKELQQRAESHIPDADEIVFLEINITDASEFDTDVAVHGRIYDGGPRILWANAASIPNTIASILIAIRDSTGVNPDVYFEWSEGDPIVNLLKFLFIGEGEVAPVTREILRRAEPELTNRPHVHVG